MSEHDVPHGDYCAYLEKLHKSGLKEVRSALRDLPSPRPSAPFKQQRPAERRPSDLSVADRLEVLAASVVTETLQGKAPPPPLTSSLNLHQPKAHSVYHSLRPSQSAAVTEPTPERSEAPSFTALHSKETAPEPTRSEIRRARLLTLGALLILPVGAALLSYLSDLLHLSTPVWLLIPLYAFFLVYRVYLRRHIKRNAPPG